MALHFSKEEFQKRKDDVLKAMNKQNLDALLMFRQESMYWLTGYDTFGYVFFQTLVLDKNGNLIAFAITMPSFSRALKKINGKLFPFGFLRILKAQKFNDKASLYLIILKI